MPDIALQGNKESRTTKASRRVYWGSVIVVVLFIAACIWVTWIDPWRRRMRATEQLEELGSSVDFREAVPAWFPNDLRKRVENHSFFMAVDGVRLEPNTALTDTLLDEVGSWPAVQRLRFTNGAADDRLLSKFTHYVDATYLAVEAGDFTDDSFRHLTRWDSLESLEFNATDVRGSGFSALHHLPKLRTISMSKGKLDVAGVAEILSLPHLRTLSLRRMHLPKELFQEARRHAFAGLELDSCFVAASLGDCEPELRALCRLRIPKCSYVRFRDAMIWGREVQDDGSVDLVIFNGEDGTVGSDVRVIRGAEETKP